MAKMAKMFKSLFELSIDEFESMRRPSQKQTQEKRLVIAQPARLIPAYPKLDELSLASVFLATLPLVKEFRDIFSKEVKLGRSGTLHAYTEVSFPEAKVNRENAKNKGPLRVDGLVLQVVGRKIRDAALFEFKMGGQKLDADQINAYQELAKAVGITKLISISNQYVSSPTDYPIEVKRVRGVDLFHFSWRHIIAFGSHLLTDNQYNIADPDQVKIMQEVMAFLRNPAAKAYTFDAMGKGWLEVVGSIKSDEDFFKRNLPCIESAIRDWLEEEQDLALKMSDELGVLVDTRIRGNRTMEKRIETEKQRMEKDKILLSQFSFPLKDIVSPLIVSLNLKSGILFCDVEVQVRQITIDSINHRRSIGSQLNPIRNQLEKCRRENTDEFNAIENELSILVKKKGSGPNPHLPYTRFDDLLEESLGNRFTSVVIRLERDFNKHLNKSRVFVREYEECVRTFYSVVVQHLENYKEPSPKMKVKKDEEETDTAT
ncbi:MAG TPA: hypothetical protein VFC80_05785 [Sphaerochaeta sp.]|nr:hypothetical protein [Sphaerochaeta sp.]